LNLGFDIDLLLNITWSIRYWKWKFWVQGCVIHTFILDSLHQTIYDLLKHFNIEPWLWHKSFTRYSMNHEILELKFLNLRSCNTYLHFRFFASKQITWSYKIYLQILSLLFIRIFLTFYFGARFQISRWHLRIEPFTVFFYLHLKKCSSF
jgi:hypothetical protein